MLEELPSGDDLLRGHFVPGRGGHGPSPGRSESGRIDRRLFAGGLPAEIGNGDGAPIADSAAARLVREYREDPVLQRGALLERVEALDHGQPSLLHDLFGSSAIADESQRHAGQTAVEAMDQRSKGRLVAGSQSGIEVAGFL